MGRNKRRPPEYAPLVQFYLRAKLEGGKLLHPGDLKAQLDAKARRECLVLVHGFNNTDSEAAEAYLGFRTRQKEIFQTPDLSGFERRFGDTFWPGDADWWSFFDKLDFLIYPAAVHTAVKAAQELANLLWDMPNLERVDFIGHSLGSRVVLETLPLLRKRTLPMIGRVVLMAAAVPSEMLELNGKFYGLLMEMAAEGTTIRVLYSKADSVLHYAFPPGQSLAGGREASARALGRFGPTPWMPGFRSTLTDREIDGASHGDYWGQSKTPSSRIATEDAGRFLGLGDMGRDVGTPRAIGVSQAPQQPRDLGVIREFGEVGP
jgi:pimeloyl-ACP methyl ester carboxylesterase